MKLFPAMAILWALTSSSALAAPGVGEKVYGAKVEKGVSEIEARYGGLVGGSADGEYGTVLEFSHGFSDRLYAGLLFELEREPDESVRLEATGIESIVALGHLSAIDSDVAVYAEYEGIRDSADKVETKLLLQHRKGAFDGRLNLIAEKLLETGQPVSFGYAASADWELVGDLRGGVEAFGDVGTARHPFTRAEHFAGPMLKTEIEGFPGRGELGIEAAYLVALGSAREETDGQARLLLEYEFHF